MKHFLLILFLVYSKACLSQKMDIYGTYYTSFPFIYGQQVVSILKLDSNNTFNYYETIDEGDVRSECLSSGKFSIINDSLMFESIYDSSYNTCNTKNIYFVDFSRTKINIINSILQANNIPVIDADRNNDLHTFSKFNFLLLDSIKSFAVTDCKFEEILITKRNFARLTSSDFKYTKTFNILTANYDHILSRLPEINFFSLIRNRKDSTPVFYGCIELFIGKIHFSACGNSFTQELYDLLFRSSLAE